MKTRSQQGKRKKQTIFKKETEEKEKRKIRERIRNKINNGKRRRKKMKNKTPDRNYLTLGPLKT